MAQLQHAKSGGGGRADRTGRCKKVDGRADELVRGILAFPERSSSDWRKTTATEPGTEMGRNEESAGISGPLQAIKASV